MAKRLQWSLLTMLLCWHQLTAWSDDTLIDFQGDHYVINVAAMEADSEMTLSDVLLLCPELMPDNGRLLGRNFILNVDGMDLYFDIEDFLSMVKANEVETVNVYVNPSISQGVGGTDVLVDINYKKPSSDGVSGKATMEGSTYGNGLLYADAKMQQGGLNMKGYVLADLQYAKGDVKEGGVLTQRQTIQNAHVSIAWDISARDNLTVKLTQQFSDYKERYRHTEDAYTIPDIERLGNLALCYTRTLNNHQATLVAEAGGTYLSENSISRIRQVVPYCYAELNTPLLSKHLWMLAGVENDYENSWTIGDIRQENLKNDFYLQLDYARGPWNLTLGTRHTLLHYRDRSYNGNADNQTHHMNATSFLASAGYKWGRHHVRGSFNRDFYIPVFDNLYENLLDVLTYNTGNQSNLIWRSELRYTYQQRNITFTGSLTHMWETDLPTPREELTGIKTSVTWRQGPLRLTAGAYYCHQRLSATDEVPAQHDNYYVLKLAPTLLLANGLRLSATLLYQSEQRYNDCQAYLYASVKVNKDLGPRLNAYADFRNLAGMPQLSIYKLQGSYRNRALTAGVTYRL